MRNYSRDNLRSFQRQGPVKRTLTGEKLVAGALKETQIRIGKYKYDSSDVLGKGYSSNVFKGIQILKSHKRYAIKVIDLKKFRGSSLDMLQSQIEIHRSLQHQNIVKLHEVIKTAHHYYLIMQYCPHGNLNQYIIQKKQLCESNAIQIMNQIISAYKHLINQGIIHRDIKPANILRVGNKWKISDFGFAARSRFGFKDRMNVGTPLYMAPQSLKKNFYSYKSDLFSLGIVMFEMIVGETPHQVSSERELLEKINTQIIVPKSLKNMKIQEFMARTCIISEAKRMPKEDFQTFDFGATPSSSVRTNSNSTSAISLKGKDSAACDDLVLKDYLTATNSASKLRRDYSSKQTSKECSRQPSSTSKRTYSGNEQTQKTVKNPIIANREAHNLELEFVQHFYYTIRNIDSFHLIDTTKSMFVLALFKLLLKILRLLCDKSQNYFKASNWEEYQQCKLHQQLYTDFTTFSERYEKEYLEFIRHNDIKVIRAVNRKFPELCNNSLLTAKFYDNFRQFLATVIREHNAEIARRESTAEEGIADRYQALGSALTIFRVAELRSNEPTSPLFGEKPSLLEDYMESKKGKADFANLKRLAKDL